MGETKRHVTFRLAEDDLVKIDRIQQALHPFAEDRTSTLRVIIKIVWSLIFTPGTLADLVEVLQRLRSHTLAHKQLEIRFPAAIGQEFFPKIHSYKEGL